MDPTSGVAALFVIGGLATLRHALVAAHSREHEMQADELGLILAARACFDTRAGAEVMRKMSEHKVAMAQPVSKGQQLKQKAEDPTSTVVKLGQQLMDTHPPSMDRYHRLVEMSQEHNYRAHKHCMTVTTRLYDALWPRSQSQGKGS